MITDQPYCSFAVVKVASRCNLNCTYCYMYNQADQTYSSQPKRITPEITRSLFLGVKDHCRRHTLKQFVIVIHGGEPLLLGRRRFRDFVEDGRKIVGSEIDLVFTVQTNGILIDDKWCDLFKELRILVGISVDGPESIHDKYRLDHQGHGSFQRTLSGLRKLQSCGINPTVLSVINPSISPREFIKSFIELDIHRVDLLLPDANHKYPNLQKPSFESTIFGDWLVDLFDNWISLNRPFSVRLFEYAFALLRNINVSIDAFGSSTNHVFVLETDGEIAALDVLRTCYDGASSTGCNIVTSTIDEALQSPIMKAYSMSGTDVPSTCRNCKFKKECAGGYLPHRYSGGEDFDNPSYYCYDLYRLFSRLDQVGVSALRSG